MADVHSDWFRVEKTESFGYMTKNKKGDMTFRAAHFYIKEKVEEKLKLQKREKLKHVHFNDDLTTYRIKPTPI